MITLNPYHISTQVLQVEETTKGYWDCLLQQFILTQGNPYILSKKEAKTLWTKTLEKTIDKLSQKPQILAQTPKGTIQKPPQKILCPQCGSHTINIPLIAKGDTTIEIVKPGKGEATCNCGYKGTKAKIKNYNMYEYAQLIRQRQALFENLKTALETLDDQLA